MSIINFLQLFLKGALPRSETINLDITDWSDVFEAAQSYNPGVIPLPIRMGRPRPNKTGDVPPHDKGNIELLKVCYLFLGMQKQLRAGSFPKGLTICELFLHMLMYLFLCFDMFKFMIKYYFYLIFYFIFYN